MQQVMASAATFDDDADVEPLIALFDQTFITQFNTRLVRGGDEPVYLPANATVAYHQVVFAHGYFSSALHEIAHWCIAGERRRLLEDYGYWYYNGCLRPAMLSCMIALDRTTPENGCLKVVKGSHLMGRIDHVPLTEKQNEADPERMKHILAQHEVVDAILDPGDVFIFHCNTLHRSDRNASDKRRWTLLICYNAISNDAYVADDDRSYVPLDKVDDGAIKRAGLRFSDANQEHFAAKPFVPNVRRAS